MARVVSYVALFQALSLYLMQSDSKIKNMSLMSIHMILSPSLNPITSKTSLYMLYPKFSIFNSPSFQEQFSISNLCFFSSNDLISLLYIINIFTCVMNFEEGVFIQGDKIAHLRNWGRKMRNVWGRKKMKMIPD